MSGLAAAVGRLLDYERYRQAAGRVADEIHALPPIDEAVDSLVAIADARAFAA